MEQVVAKYIERIAEDSAAGNATEHTYRSSLEMFIEGLCKGYKAINEPKRVVCGAPDFVVQKEGLTIGYVEAKDVHVDLTEAARSEQLQRYRHALDNLVLTNYLEFHWYVHGELRDQALLAARDSHGKLVGTANGAGQVAALIRNFASRAPEPITSPEELARRLARVADMIRDIVVEAFEQKQATYTLLPLRNAFARTLLPELELQSNTREFADMYAQTLAYGLFAARCNHDPAKGEFRRLGAAAEIPKTNPFLRDLFESMTGTKLDEEPFAGFVDDLVQVLAHADMESILQAFGMRTGRQDPVVHFYETFLAEYDPKLREVRGVYYTPEEVVSYIVRSVDAVLKRLFALGEGLGDVSRKVNIHNGNGVAWQAPKVLILDPACGTGTFLYAVVDLIREQLRVSGQGGTWSGYVKEHLLPRLFGFELLMAPYAVAHLKLGMQLAGMDLPEEERRKWAYDFSIDERLGVYLTNTLDLLERQMEVDLPGVIQTISREGKEAQHIKDDLPIMVILGNPPYSGHSANASWKKANGKTLPTFIGKLIEDYKSVNGAPLGERNIKWLQDDYVKFIRWAQWRVDKTGAGVVGFITNHSYLDNPTFRGMRASLMQSFSHIYILNLHGNARKKERAPDGTSDQNVFDIEQGVAVLLLVKNGQLGESAQVQYADLWGSRQDKYEYLASNDIESTNWQELAPCSPSWWFVPWQDELQEEYNAFWKITDIFPVHSVGIVTARDKLTIGWTAEEVWQRVVDFASRSPESARQKYSLSEDVRDWKVEWAQEDITQSGPDRSCLREVLYRPFDVRWTYYTGKTRGFICMPRRQVMQHMQLPGNLALMCCRQVNGQWNHVAVSNQFVEDSCLSTQTKERGYVFPLYLLSQHAATDDALSSETPHGEKVALNLNKDFVQELCAALEATFSSAPAAAGENVVQVSDIVAYIYAILHSSSYRQRYQQFLKSDFPRIPLPSDRVLFQGLVACGSRLIALHLLEDPVLSVSQFITQYPESALSCPQNYVDTAFPQYDDNKQAVYINAEQYFQGVPETLWQFHVGGYQVLHKWLKDRRDRCLSHDEIMTYQKIVLSLSETMIIMDEIDRLIPSWPLA